MLSPWIEPKSVYVRKLENVHHITSGSGFIWIYNYDCGVDPLTQPHPSPPPDPQDDTWVSTLVYSRLNDPSIKLPQP